MNAEPAEIVTTPEAAQPFVEEWRELLADLDGSSYFSTPDWTLAWWETLGANLQAEVAIWRGQKGELQGIAALARRGERLHRRLPWTLSAWTMLGAGTAAADHCAWPVRSARIGDVRAWLETKSRRVPMILSNLDPELGRPLVPRFARCVALSRCPRLLIHPGDEHLGTSTHFKKQLRGYCAKLSKEGVTFRWVPPEEMNASALRIVFELHARRRALTNGVTTFTQDRLRLHERLIDRSGLGRGPALVIGEHGGRPIAALYGFMWRDVFAYYQSGWEPEWARSSLGTILVSEAINFARQAGARVFDFLRGSEDYKYRFGSFDRVDETWVVPTGVSGRLLDLRHGWRSRGNVDNDSRRYPARGRAFVS